MTPTSMSPCSPTLCGHRAVPAADRAAWIEARSFARLSVASQAWNESWNEWPRYVSEISASGAIGRAICAGSGAVAYAHASRNA